jgi:curved DNA-binding protein CbpA
VDSPFDVLRIDEDADEAEIERAYRRRVKEAHPDLGGSASEFQRVRRAYEALVSEDGTRTIGPERGPADSRPRPADDADSRADRDRDRDRDGGGRRRSATADEPDESDEPDDEPQGVRVEYLNYEVLDDHGWSLDDEDLFEKASAADLDPADYGQILVEPRESLLQAAENRGFAWPYACRGGACANCAVAAMDGEMGTPMHHILPSEMIDRGIRLSCISAPTTDGAQVVYNVKHLPSLDELRLPPYRFERERASD